MQLKPQAAKVWNALRLDQPLPGKEPKPTATATPSGPPLVTPPENIRVQVLNGSGVTGAAKKLADQLRAAGFVVVRVGDADRSDYSTTTVLHDPAYDESGRTLGASITGSTVTEDISLGSTLTVVVGADSPDVVSVDVTGSHQLPVSRPRRCRSARPPRTSAPDEGRRAAFVRVPDVSIDPSAAEPAAALRPADKVYESAAAAVADIRDGASLAVGGFGLCGVPTQLIAALHDAGTADLHVVSNNCGVDEWGLGVLLADHRIARVVASYVGENKEFARQFLSGELEVELTPQGTLAERLRAGGAGIPAFYTVTGVGTQVAEGGLPWRYDADGNVGARVAAQGDPRVRARRRDAQAYVLEESIVTDFALVHAWKGDRSGNLVYRESARNFNPLCATAGRVTIAQVEHLVEVGEIRPEDVHTPGVFVQRVVDVGPDVEKRIERRTTRPRQEA